MLLVIRKLLKDLQVIWGEFKVRIVLITNAGFCSTWFNKIREIGWDYETPNWG